MFSEIHKREEEYAIDALLLFPLVAFKPLLYPKASVR